MNPVVHFEMAYEDKNRVAKFYSETFGWKPQFLGEEMGEYVVVQTDETDDKGMLKETNRINGGLYKKMEDPAMNTPSVVIAVENIEESMKKITEGGGKVLGSPMDIPGIGKYVSFYDTEGNRASILQPLNKMN
jgi:uncharacterized protein